MINRPITSLLGSAVPMAQQQLGYTRQPPMMNVPTPQIQTPSQLSSLLAPAPQQKPSMMSGLLSGPGSSARYAALAKALTQNSATPMSLGQRITGGLLAGSDAAKAQEQAAFDRGLLEREMALKAEEVRLKELEVTGKGAGKAGDIFDVIDVNTGDIVGQVLGGTEEHLAQVSNPGTRLSRIGTTQAKSREKAKSVNVILPDGTRTYARETEFGELILQNGERAPSGTIKFGVGVSSENVEGLAPVDKKAFSDFEDLRAKTATLFNTGNKVLELLEETPEASTIVGSISKLGSAAYQNVEQVAKVFGIPDEKLKDYENIFEETSVNSSVLKSMVLDLAYQAAAVRGQEGKGASDKDIKMFSQIIGGQSLSPKERAATLRNYLESIKEEAAQTANALSKRAKQDLILPELNIYTPASSKNPKDNDGGDRAKSVQEAIDEANRLAGR